MSHPIDTMSREELEQLDPAALSQEELTRAQERYNQIERMQARLEAQRLSGTPDPHSPASVSQRFFAGLPATERDRLAAVRRDYPEAETLEGRTFVPDPDTGNLAPWTDSGPVGNVASAAPEIATVAGASAATMPFARRFTPRRGASIRENALRLLLGGGAAAAGGALGRAAVEGGAYLAGSPETRSGGEIAEDYGTGAALDFGGTVIPPTLVGAVRRPLGYLMRNRQAPTTVDALGAFDRLNVEPTLGTVGSQSASQIEQGVRGTLGGGRIGEAIQQQRQGVDAAVEGIAQTGAPGPGRPAGQPPQPGQPRAPSFDPLQGGATVEGAGTQVQRGLSTWRQQFDDTANYLYDTLGRLLPRDTGINMTNTYRQLIGEWNEMAGAPALRDVAHQGPATQYREALLNDLRSAAAARGLPANLTIDQLLQQVDLPYEAVNALRQRIGRDIGQPPGVGGERLPDAQARAVYGTLMQDVEGSIQRGVQAGNLPPETQGAYDRARRYYSAGMRRAEEVSQFADNPNVAQAYQALVTGSTGAQATPQYIRAVRRSVPPEAWDAVAGRRFDDLGRRGGPDSEWSASTFLRNWDRLGEDSRRILFGGTRYEELQQPMRDVVTAAQAIERSGAWRNHSNTAYTQHILASLGILGGGGAAAVGANPTTAAEGTAGSLAAVYVPPMVVSMLMTNPRFVRWIANAPRVVGTTPPGTPQTTRQIMAHLSRLTGLLANERPEVRDAAQVVSDSLTRGLQASGLLPQQAQGGQGGQ